MSYIDPEHLLFFGLYFLIVLFAKWVREAFTSFDTVKALVIQDNLAFSVSYAGYMFAVTIVYMSVLIGPTTHIFDDILIVLVYSVASILMLNLAKVINDKFILSRFSNQVEIIEKRNLGVGIVQLGSYLASALIIAGAVFGEDENHILTILYFIIGQVILILYSKLYNKICGFDINEEIQQGNSAVALSFSGHLIAIGVILCKAGSAPFVSMTVGLQHFLLFGVISCIFPFLFRLFYDRVIIPESPLKHEVINDRNNGAAFLELVFVLGSSIVLVHVI